MEFPITSNVVLPGSDRTVVKVLNYRDVVKCYWCKEPFLVDEMSVRVVDKYGNKALRCPACEKMVSVLYYYDGARPSTRRDRNLIAMRARRRRARLRDRDA